jgi:hypothetical protein
MPSPIDANPNIIALGNLFRTYYSYYYDSKADQFWLYNPFQQSTSLVTDERDIKKLRGRLINLTN